MPELYQMPPKVTHNQLLFEQINSMNEQEIIALVSKIKQASREAGLKHIRIAHRMRKSVTTVSLIERFGCFSHSLITDYVTAVQCELKELQKEEVYVK